MSPRQRDDSATRILIADDHDIVRHALRAFLDLDSALEVVGEAADGAQAVRLAHRLRPDVVLMDLVMPELDGIAATEVIHRELPDTKVVVLTSLLEDELVVRALCAGAIAPTWARYYDFGAGRLPTFLHRLLDSGLN